MSTRTVISRIPAVSRSPEHPILSASHAVEALTGLLAIDDPLDPTLAVEDISGLDQAACLDRADRAFAGLRSLGRLSALQVWIAGQALARAKDLAKHGTWTTVLRDHRLAESTVRQAIRVFRAFPDPTYLPPQITQTKIAAGIVQHRPARDPSEVGQPIEVEIDPVEPKRNPDSSAEAEPSPYFDHNDVEVDCVAPSRHHITPEIRTRPDGGPNEKKWLDGEPVGDVGNGYAWHVLAFGEKVRVVWAPIAHESDSHVTTTTGLRLAREEGIYRSRRNALLGASALYAEQVEQLKANLDEASRSLSKVNALLADD